MTTKIYLKYKMALLNEEEAKKTAKKIENLSN